VQNQNRSEVALLKQRIAMESEAAKLAMYGPLRGAAKHSFITKRMENMGGLKEDLAEYVGDDEATKFLIRTMESKAIVNQN
jgi:hypothetical protein